MILGNGWNFPVQRHIYDYATIHFYILILLHVTCRIMKDFLVVKDPETAKLFADPCRRSILHNLRHYEMTPYQLSKILGKNVSSAIYHLDALEKAGLVEQTRSLIKGNLIKKFYKATAKRFVISYTLSEGIVPGSEDIVRWSREVCKSAVASLSAFGYDLPTKKVGKIARFMEKYSSLEQIAYEEVVSRQKTPVQVNHAALKLLVSLLTNVQLYKNPDFLEIIDEISAELEGAKRKAV
jgi:DNA-binding transcriptional ArsR family regulator